MSAPPFFQVMNNAITMVPASYPELEAEVYASLEFVCDRSTELPPPSFQIGLELECAGLEVEWA